MAKTFSGVRRYPEDIVKFGLDRHWGARSGENAEDAIQCGHVLLYDEPNALRRLGVVVWRLPVCHRSASPSRTQFSTEFQMKVLNIVSDIFLSLLLTIFTRRTVSTLSNAYRMAVGSLSHILS